MYNIALLLYTIIAIFVLSTCNLGHKNDMQTSCYLIVDYQNNDMTQVSVNLKAMLGK